MVSVEVGGPHPSSEGSAEMISDIEIGAMIADVFGCDEAVEWVTLRAINASRSQIFAIVEAAFVSGAAKISHHVERRGGQLAGRNDLRPFIHSVSQISNTNSSTLRILSHINNIAYSGDSTLQWI